MVKTSNYQRTADWLFACGKEQTTANLSVQIGCHIEEFTEFLTSLALTGDSTASTMAIALTVETLGSLADDLKRGMVIGHIPKDRRAEVLDALCDQEVTLNGVAYLANFDKEAADEAVLASNEAKLVDGKPVLAPGGKILKPEGWVAPDLTPFV